MGKAAVLGALAVTLTVMSLVYTTQLTSRETQIVQSRAVSNDVARDLAEEGRKLVLSSWVESQGAMNAAPFQSTSKNGGTITVTDFTTSADIIDVTIRGEYQDAIHDIRSRYQWNGYGLNPFQIKAAAINLDIAPGTDLDFDKITLDDQALQDLNDVLISDLGLAASLSDLGLGFDKISEIVSDELSTSGNSDIALQLIDAAQRTALNEENGMYFPDQVEQVIMSYIASNPSNLTTVSSLPSSFGDGSGEGVLKVTDDMVVVGNFTGSGILIVEGDIQVPATSTFNWDGIILVKPPATDMNPQIDMSGVVNINGGIIALHEAMPNSGHMDVTTFRDMSGNWSSSSGADKKIYYWPWCMYHKHDFTSAYGNSITYWASSSSDRVHESQIHFNDTLKKLSGSDTVFLEIYNPSAHGRGTMSLDLAGSLLSAYPVSAGFDPLHAAPGNVYRTQTFAVNELEYLHIDINRLSSLKKMWDSSSNYPGCSTNSGPLCVGYDYNRMGSLTLRLYTVSSGTEKKVYEASMYWHRRTDEEAAFNTKMAALVASIQDPSYGLDINLGNNTTIKADNAVLNMLSKMSGGSVGYSHLGSWQKHWDPLDPNNPNSTN